MTLRNNQTITPRVVTFEDAMNLAIGRAKQLVSCLIKERGHDKPPFLPQEFARLTGIKQIIKAELGKTSAVLLKFHDGHVIKVNQNHNLTRQNFSCAHEIGHNLLRELKIGLNTENIEYRTFDPQAPGRIVAKARERLCDIIATELLMPEMIFKKYLSGFGVSIYSIERLADVFRVSIRAALWRIAEVSPEPCIALLWQRQRTNSKVLQLAWRTGPGRRARGKSQYIPLHTRVTYPSTLHKAYEHDIPVTCHRHFRLDSVVKRVLMESKGFGRGDTRRVVSLAFPDR